MTRTWKIVLAAAGVAFAVTAASAAFAQASGTQSTPFNYEIKDGKRVPKPSSRVAAADGSWREETKKGGCTEIKEMSPSGELKITRKCD